MEALEAILTRRSTRRFSAEMPDKKTVEAIIDAGRHAPSGGNNQTTHFIVISDPAVLSELVVLVREAFSKMEVYPGMYSSMKSNVIAAKAGKLVFHYNAPILIVTANRKGYGNALADSACALENMMIAANAMDLGTCWINQLHWLDEDPVIREYMLGLGLEENETITGGLVIGYGEGGLPVRSELPRTGNPVTWVE